MDLNRFKKMTCSEMMVYLNSIVVVDSVVVAPEHEIPNCGLCGSEPLHIAESEPSTARFNEGAVHYKVICSNDECEKRAIGIWDIQPVEAADTFGKPGR